MKKTIFIIFVLFLSNILFSQNNDNVSFFNLNDFRLRYSFDNEDNFTKPAEFSVSLPKGEKGLYLINSAIGIDFSVSSNSDSSIFYDVTFTPFIEYFRNSSTNDEKNLIKIGNLIEWQLFNIKNGFTPISITKISYNRDFLNESKSLFLSEYITFQIKSKGVLKYLLPQEQRVQGKILSYDYCPSIGVELENKLSTKEGQTKGTNSAICGSFQITFIPLESLLNKRLELSTDFKYRYYFNNKYYSTGNYMRYFSQSIDFVLYKKDPAAVLIGANYTFGNDPTKSVFNEDVWSFVLKIKL